MPPLSNSGIHLVTVLLATLTLWGFTHLSALAQELPSNKKPVIARLEPPPFDYYFADFAEDQTKKQVRLRQVAVEPNEVVDMDAWFINNGLSLPLHTHNMAPYHTLRFIPDLIPKQTDQLTLNKAIKSGDNILLIYGEDRLHNHQLHSFDTRTGNIGYIFDFIEYTHTPMDTTTDLIYQNLQWATQMGDILYLCHAHNTYAASSNNFNAYLTAIDIKKKRIRWRSKPLICNSKNFLALDDVLISGYGFTQETDSLYVLNRWNGKVISRIALATMVDYIIHKDGMLYVRAYDKNYVFEITSVNVYGLQVNTIPADAKIRIMNIRPKFYQNIKLPSGRYQVEVTAEGYHKYLEWVEIDNEDLVLKVNLTLKP